MQIGHRHRSREQLLNGLLADSQLVELGRIKGGALLTEQELATCQRLRLGIESIAAAVQRLNDLGAPLRVPPIAIRFQPSPLIHGENPYSAFVTSMMCDEHLCRIELLAQPERLAA